MNAHLIALLAAKVGLPRPVQPSAEVLAACSSACSHFAPELRRTAEAQTLGRLLESFSRAVKTGAWVDGRLTFATKATGRRLFLEAEATDAEAIVIKLVAR